MEPAPTGSNPTEAGPGRPRRRGEQQAFKAMCLPFRHHPRPGKQADAATFSRAITWPPRGCGSSPARPQSPWWSWTIPAGAGSSCLLRGVLDVLGTIPAGAGSSCSDRTGRLPRRDHPLRCGEQLRTMASATRTEGPSQRVRGADRRQVGRPPHGGTIPTDAGSMPSLSTSQTLTWDHPRRCGGAGHLRPAVLRRTGIIPASPGSRCCGAGCAPPGRDHPRGYGEQHMAVGERHQACGTIPTDAGSSCGRRPGAAIGWDHPCGCGEQVCWPTVVVHEGDHPRGCGEQGFVPVMAVFSMGPSPRVRGAGGLDHRCVVVDGTIPASAGSRRP
ncbi:conserved hypothetical protein, annotated as incomplete [Streptomyces rapamycinicus NRRL 5491]|uniref:Uncharacterized protein n=1 Tax=Streptomyces rapamycinicus (strain ATCC 29253 / DSM 41530 / NRRL 5491 / AYB-994) TaxID=1343740 RepID=A0A3L8RI19_STRRN|nr:conserved hypothetical protein, annotated as incomplete [Streptomyces rapamycinicus NRRL 5491]